MKGIKQMETQQEIIKRNRYDHLKKIISIIVEYADFGGEENFVKEEDVLAENFTEAEEKLAAYLEGRQYHIISYCWKKSVIDKP